MMQKTTKIIPWPLPLPLVIAGPCSAESLEQVLCTAKAIEGLPYLQGFRAGLWKPRTQSGQFEGVGESGLPWLKSVESQSSLWAITEVARPKHVEKVLSAGLQAVWLGARTVANPFMVEELARSLKGTDLIVMVKNPINPDLGLWNGAIKRLRRHQVDKLVAIHRGFSSSNPNPIYRFAPYWRIPFEFKRQNPEIPLLCDPSHIAGKRDLVKLLAQKAICLGFDGLIIEVHPQPEVALSDAKQQLTPVELHELLNTLPWRCSPPVPPNAVEQLEALREQIDELDQEILALLSHRQKIVKEIADIKKKNQMSILQIKRFQEMLSQRLSWAQKLSLEPKAIEELFNLIHELSATLQSDYLSQLPQNYEDNFNSETNTTSNH